MKWLIALITILLFSACGTMKDLSRIKAERYYNNNLEEFAKACATKYPEKVFKGAIITDTLYIDSSAAFYVQQSAEDWIQRHNERVYDDTTEAGIKYRQQIYEAQNIIKELLNAPPRTVTRTKVDTLRDTRMLAENSALKLENSRLIDDLGNLNTDVATWREKARNRQYVLIGIYIISGLSFAGWLVSKFKTINIKK